MILETIGKMMNLSLSEFEYLIVGKHFNFMFSNAL